ncbi:MAG: TonB-dependent receptor plug domain-containing protein [Polyangiaceae bacterium]
MRLRGAAVAALFALLAARPVLAEDPPKKVEGEADNPAEDAIDVTVEGQRLDPGVTTLTRAESRQLPGAFGDPFRAIEILPGVTPIVSGVPFFYVRGAPPGNVGYFLDGVRVPYLFHVAAGPSVIHPAIIDRVDLHAGGYPAEYGGYAGAIVAASAAQPRPDWHGEANVRIVDAGAIAEVGFAKDADGVPHASALVGGRFSYTAALFSLISPEVTLDYRDYQARVTYDPTSRDRVSLFTFGAYDFLSNTTEVVPPDGGAPAPVEQVLFGAEFYRVDARWDHRLPKNGSMRAAATFGYDRTRVVDGRNTNDYSFGTRFELRQPITDGLTLRGGFGVQHDLYSADPLPFVDPDDPQAAAFEDLFPSRNDATAGAWADAVIDVGRRFHVTPGVRVDTYFSNGASATSVDPRLAITADIGDRVRLLHAVGVAHQPPSFVVPVPGLAVSDLSGGLQTSLQASAGVEVQLPESITATATVFDSVFFDMTDTLGVLPAGDVQNSLPRSLGGAKGLELYVRKSLSSRIGGFVSYTFSRSTRTVDGYTFPAAFDRAHVLHSAVAFDLGRGWRLGTRFSIYSGTPILTPPPGSPLGFRPSDPDRDPVFYRIDFRLEKKWRIRDVGWISFVTEMVNTTLHTETIQGNEIGPVSIPSLGVEAGL